MSLTSQQIVELEVLLSELADERLSDERRRRLEELLEAEPKALDRYIRYMALCSDLGELAATVLGAEEDDPSSGTRPVVPPSAGGRPFESDAGGRPSWRWPLGGGSGAGVAVLGALLLAALWVWGPGARDASELGPPVGRLQGVDGVVVVSEREDAARRAAVGLAIRAGQTVTTCGPDSHAEVHLPDGTVVLVAGETRLRFATTESDRIDVESGSIAASVRPRAKDRPLVIATREARVEVLGTRLSVARGDRRTRVGVLDGDVRVTRLSDERTVTLSAGQAAEASPRTDLRPTPIRSAPDTWSLDFDEGLPAGWQTGQLVLDELPEGCGAAVRATPVRERGQKRHMLRSHNAWSEGLFTLYDDSWIHIRYRMERPGSFLPYVVCRQRDFGQPVATVLTRENVRQREAGRWHTLSLPARALHRTRTRTTVPLEGQLVAFLLVIDSPAHDAGLTVARIWVTRAGSPHSQPRP